MRDKIALEEHISTDPMNELRDDAGVASDSGKNMTPDPRLQRLHAAGVSIWLDTLSRELLASGEFAELIHDYSVTGATSNSTIFAKAITGSERYDTQLRRLFEDGQHDPQKLFFGLALDDVREAAHELCPNYDQSDGQQSCLLRRNRAQLAGL